MNTARAALKSAKSAGKSFVKPKYADGGLLGANLEELIRQATAKDLPGPNYQINRQICEAVNHETGTAPAHSVEILLRKRLEMPNPHKQWLAIQLVQEVLTQCQTSIEPVRKELLRDVAQIAAKPMNRYGSDLQGQQKAKTAAFALLRSFGPEGQDVLRGVAGLGQYPTFHSSVDGPVPPGFENTPANAPATWPVVREQVQTGIATAQSQTEMLQDLVLNISSGESTNTEFERGFLKDLVKEMMSFRKKFEVVLGALGQYETEAANQLMQEALEAMDTMNNAINLQNEILEQTLVHKAQPPPASSHTAARPVPTPAIYAPARPNAAAAPTPPTPTPSPALVTDKPKPSPLDAILELQQGLDAAYSHTAAPAAASAAVDPFAASHSMAAPPKANSTTPSSALHGRTASSNNPFAPNSSLGSSLGSGNQFSSGSYGGTPTTATGAQHGSVTHFGSGSFGGTATAVTGTQSGSGNQFGRGGYGGTPTAGTGPQSGSGNQFGSGSFGGTSTASTGPQSGHGHQFGSGSLGGTPTAASGAQHSSGSHVGPSTTASQLGVEQALKASTGDQFGGGSFGGSHLTPIGGSGHQSGSGSYGGAPSASASNPWSAAPTTAEAMPSQQQYPSQGLYPPVHGTTPFQGVGNGLVTPQPQQQSGGGSGTTTPQTASSLATHYSPVSSQPSFAAPTTNQTLYGSSTGIQPQTSAGPMQSKANGYGQQQLPDLQSPQQPSSSQASTTTSPGNTAKTGTNTEWDMFFAERFGSGSGFSTGVAPGGNAKAPSMAQQKQQASVFDEFDELVNTRSGKY